MGEGCRWPFLRHRFTIHVAFPRSDENWKRTMLDYIVRDERAWSRILISLHVYDLVVEAQAILYGVLIHILHTSITEIELYYLSTKLKIIFENGKIFELLSFLLFFIYFSFSFFLLILSSFLSSILRTL